MSVGNFDLKIPTENIPSGNPLVFSEFLVMDHFSRILDWIFPTSYSRISIGTNFFIIWFKYINIKLIQR